VSTPVERVVFAQMLHAPRTVVRRRIAAVAPSAMTPFTPLPGSIVRSVSRSGDDAVEER
jgi:hypothetical protein